MIALAIIPLIVCVVGLLAYALSANAKIAEAGRIAFFAGLLVTLFVVATKVIKL